MHTGAEGYDTSAQPWLHMCDVNFAFAVILSLLTLGCAVAVDRILLPPHQHRTDFTSHAQWSEGPPGKLWDMESISDFLSQRGIALQAGLLLHDFTLKQADRSSLMIAVGL